jgi:predicted acetyltransferase
MDVQLVPATSNDDAAFRNLYQFYLYEFSRFTGWMPGLNGRFDESDLQGCWEQPDRHLFFITLNERRVGLAIIDWLTPSHISGAPEVWEMAEFFVTAGAHRKGIGRAAAFQLFDRFKGHWEVWEMQTNVNAQKFWRKIIAEYTDGNYAEHLYNNPTNPGIFQVFDS